MNNNPRRSGQSRTVTDAAWATPSEWMYRAVFKTVGKNGPLRNQSQLTLRDHEDGPLGETNLYLIGTEQQLYDSRLVVESLFSSSDMPWCDRGGIARNRYYFGELFSTFYRRRRDDRIAFFWWQPCWVPQSTFPKKIHTVRAFEKLAPRASARPYDEKEAREQYEEITIGDYTIRVPLAMLHQFGVHNEMQFIHMPRVRGGIEVATQLPVPDIIYDNMLVCTEEFGAAVSAGHGDLVDLPLEGRSGKLSCYKYYILRLCRLVPRGGRTNSDYWLENLSVGLSHYDGCVKVVETMFTSFNAYIYRYPNLAGALASLLHVPLICDYGGVAEG